MMWVFLVLLLIVLAIVLLHVIIPKKYNWPSTWKRINKIPGPPSVLYFGNAFSFLISNEEFIPRLLKFTKEYGPLWKASLLGNIFVFMTDLDDIEVILNSRSHITKGTDYAFLLPWLGTGLLLSGGKKWADHRKWLTPAFHFTILEQYVDIMNKNAKTLIKILETFEKRFPVAINPLISNCALDIICETAMGTKVNAQLGGEKEYVKSVIRMSKIFTERTLTPWLYRPCIFRIFPLGREHDRILKTIHEFTGQVIKERQKAFREKQKLKKSGDPEYGFGEKRKMSFLDLLIEISETQNRLTEEEIREEVDTFMFEGHDTTATSISWALYEIGLNPEIQEKVYQEQWEIFQETERELLHNDLQEMKYLERVIKETLRLYPSVPLISRKLEEDIRIREYEIPAETLIPIFIYHIHRNPKIYPEPEKFNPDRFLLDALRDRHPYSYIPFSAGPRNCIGQRFAMMEEKIILSYIIRNFEITTATKPENVQIMGEVILRPKEDIKIIFNKRKDLRKL